MTPCPKCGSSEIHIERRGWNARGGIFGMNALVLTCLNCGFQFRIGDTSASVKFHRQLNIIAIVVFVLWLLTKLHS